MKIVFKPWTALMCVCFLVVYIADLNAQSVGISNTNMVPDAQSILDIQSTTKGILIPRMLTSERVAISPTSNSDLGLLVYDTDFDSYWYWNGTAWQQIPNSGSVPTGSDFIVNGTAQQIGANFNIDGNGTVSDLYMIGGDIVSTGVLRIGSTTDVRVRLDTDANGSQEFQITNDGGTTPIFTVSEAGNLIADGRGQFNGNLTLVGANRNMVAGDNFRLSGTSGIDVVIDSDNSSSNTAFRIQKDGTTDLFELQEDGDIFFSDLIGTGTKLLQTDAAGQVTRSTTDASTIITGTGTPTQIAYFDAAQNITSEADLYWDAINDRLGVGTLTPDADLNVGNASGAGLYLTREDATTVADDVLGSLLFDSTDDTAPSNVDASVVIRGYASQAHGNSNKGGYLTFMTKNNVGNGAAATEHMRITATGNVGIGDASPTAKLNVDAASGDLLLIAQGGTARMLIDGSGNTTISGKFNSNGIEETSDLRFKTNITELSSSLEKITQLRGVTYNWKVAEFPERAFNDRTEIGVIAQEVEKIFPELVSTDANGFKSVQYSHMVPVLLEAIKEQQQLIGGLHTELDVLRSEFVSLKGLVHSQLESADNK